MSAPTALPGLWDRIVSALWTFCIVVAQIVTELISSVRIPFARKPYHLAKASLQKAHEYGFTPESAIGQILIPRAYLARDGQK